MAKQKENSNKKLNPQQELFCQEYIKTFHGTNSAIAAGYSANNAHVQSSRLLKNDKILDRLKELGEENERLMRMTRFQILDEVRRIAEVSAQEVEVMEYDPATGENKPTGRYKIADPMNALNALDKLGRHFGMFDAKTQLQMRKLKAEAESKELETEQRREYGPDTTTINIIDAWADDDEEE